MAKGGWERTFPLVVEAQNLKDALVKIVDSQSNQILSIQFSDIELQATRRNLACKGLKRSA